MIRQRGNGRPGLCPSITTYMARCLRECVNSKPSVNLKHSIHRAEPTLVLCVMKSEKFSFGQIAQLGNQVDTSTPNALPARGDARFC